MSSGAAAVGALAPSPTGRAGRAGTLRRLLRHHSFQVGGGVVALLLLLAAIGPVLVPLDYFETNVAGRLQPPGPGHLFGTDEFGRDVLARLVHGARISLKVGTISVGIALAAGGSLGLASGYVGGRADLLVVGLIDLLLAFPTLLFALAVVAILGPSLEHTMLAVGISSVPGFARLARATVLVTKQEAYVEAARGLGAGHGRLVRRHILPNIAASIIVLVTLAFPAALLNTAALGFVGLGAQPPTPEWGTMLSGARVYIVRAPWLVNIPGVAIVITVLGFNLLGNALRDVLDPRLKT
ncbi:MAG: ABC transporter permease [Armatimonadetes bacterium]|nr:ABC transporter permease [Armatimonadota bacterium]